MDPHDSAGTRSGVRGIPSPPRASGSSLRGSARLRQSDTRSIGNLKHGRARCHEAGHCLHISGLSRIVRDRVRISLQTSIAGTCGYSTIRRAGVVPGAGRIEGVDRQKWGVVARAAVVAMDQHLRLTHGAGFSQGRCHDAYGEKERYDGSAQHDVIFRDEHAPSDGWYRALLYSAPDIELTTERGASVRAMHCIGRGVTRTNSMSGKR